MVVDLKGPTSANLLDAEVTLKILAGGVRCRGHGNSLQDGITVEGKSTRTEASTPRWASKQATHRRRTETAQGSQRLINVTREVRRIRASYWIENPDHKDKLDMWKTSWFKEITGHALVEKAFFDQCRFGAETTKPTRIQTDSVPLEEINRKRCNHPPKEWTRPSGEKYTASHESLVQRWRTVGG